MSSAASKKPLELNRLLIIEDNLDDVVLIQRNLRHAGIVYAGLDVAENGKSAKAKLLATRYDLIMVDFTLPDMNAMHLIKEVREGRDSSVLPCLAVTVTDDRHLAVDLMKLGVYDFISKDEIDPDVLRKKIAYVVKKATADRNREKHFAELSVLALYDPLTRLPNRYLLSDRIEQNIRNARRQNEKFALLFLDLHDFKSINDNHGHTVGDAVLIELAKRLSTASRQADTVARIGGDEFVIILPNIHSRDNVETVIDKLLEHVEAPLPIGDHTFHLGAAIGYAIYPDNGEEIDAIIAAADQAMYRIKKRIKLHGR